MADTTALIGSLIVTVICLVGAVRYLSIERERLEDENWFMQQLILMLREELRAEQARRRQARPLILNGRLYLSYRLSRQSLSRN